MFTRKVKRPIKMKEAQEYVYEFYIERFNYKDLSPLKKLLNEYEVCYRVTTCYWNGKVTDYQIQFDMWNEHNADFMWNELKSRLNSAFSEYTLGETY